MTEGLQSAPGGPGPAADGADVEAAKRRTRKLSVAEGSLWSVMYGFGDSLFPLFALFLKAGEIAIAYLGAMPALMAAIAQIAGASLVDRCRRRTRLLILFCTIQALMFVPIYTAPRVFPSLAVPLLLGLVTLYTLLNGLVGPAWVSLMGDVVPSETRGNYFGLRNRIVILALSAATWISGWTLSCFEHRHLTAVGFCVVFAVASLARMGSARLFVHHYDPPYSPPADAYFSFWDFIRATPRSNFARFTFFVALMVGAANIAGPFFVVYMKRDLHWTYLQITFSQTVFLVAQFLFAQWWGRMGDRHGNRAVLVATGWMLPLLPLLWVFTTNYVALLGCQIVSGCAWSGFNVATQNFILDAVTPAKRARASAYFNLVYGVFNFLGGALGGLLARDLPSELFIGLGTLSFPSSLPIVFVVSGLLRGVAFLLLLPRFREVRPAVEPVSPHALLLRAGSGEPVVGTFVEIAGRLGDTIRRRTRRNGNGA